MRRRTNTTATHNTRISSAYFLQRPVTFCPLILFTVEGLMSPYPDMVCKLMCSPGLLLSLCDVTPESEPRPELAPPTPGWCSLRPGPGGQGPALRGQWYDGITRLNNVRIIGLKPRLSMGSLGITQTVKLLEDFCIFKCSLQRSAPPSLCQRFAGFLLHDKIEIGVDTPSSWNATNASPWISN